MWIPITNEITAYIAAALAVWSIARPTLEIDDAMPFDEKLRRTDEWMRESRYEDPDISITCWRDNFDSGSKGCTINICYKKWTNGHAEETVLGAEVPMDDEGTVLVDDSLVNCFYPGPWTEHLLTIGRRAAVLFNSRLGEGAIDMTLLYPE